MLETVEMETGSQPAGAVIWLHGLGADGHDFGPVVPELRLPEDLPLRFVFPHAPIRPVTINAGMRMRAWYDIVAIDRQARQDEEGIRESAAATVELIEREKERGIPAARIVLAGFSQGGAIAIHTALRYPERLAGLIALSTWMPLGESLAGEGSAANRDLPVFMAHGRQDPMVPVVLGEQTRETLAAAGYPLEWQTYDMPHAVCPAEIADISAWLQERFRQAGS
ncbi:alpha/beta hydrolase [Lentisalinibacter sediminis]|uniref:alpha/beta hydrolase n=1 Tax=Lentisalinibacter sediminis TaxID=2992237 RepID=UPI0038686AD3